MGCGASKTHISETQIVKLSKKGINCSLRAFSNEDELAADFNKNKLLMKILCLGISNSGKSTIIKQMRLIHLDGFSQDEKAIYKDSMLHMFVISVHHLLEGMPEEQGGEFKNTVSALAGGTIRQIKDRESFLPDAVRFFDSQTGKDLLSMFAISDPCRNFVSYFLNRVKNVSEFSDMDTTPEDILRVRVRTTGIVYTKFNYKSTRYCMIDVGGQKSERRKWIHHFDDVKAIFYVVDISDFSRLQESLELFSAICKTKSLQSASIILFFNKIDIFRERKDRHKISEYFPEYKDTGSFTEASEFLRNLFEEQHKGKNSEVYSFFTCAMDTRNIDRTFGACSDIILKNSLLAAGLY